MKREGKTPASDFEKAVKKYDELISEFYCEDVTIGDDEEKKENWNLRDLVAEMDYCLSRFYEEGNANFEDRKDDYDEWLSATRRMKRFVQRWLPKCHDMKPYERHCSYYDDPGVNHFINYHVM